MVLNLSETCNYNLKLVSSNKIRNLVKMWKRFLNPIKSILNQIVFAIFQLIWNQTGSYCIYHFPNQSVHGKYNLIWVWFAKISKKNSQCAMGYIAIVAFIYLREFIFKYFFVACVKSWGNVIKREVRRSYGVMISC